MTQTGKTLGVVLLFTTGVLGSKFLQSGVSPGGGTVVPVGTPAPAVTAVANQSRGELNFAPDQKKLDLQLRSDQTVSTWVHVVNTKKDNANKVAKGNGNDQGETKQKDVAIKKGAANKRAAASKKGRVTKGAAGDANNKNSAKEAVGQGKKAEQKATVRKDDGDKAQDDDKNKALVPITFYLNITKRGKFSSCTQPVTTLIGEATIDPEDQPWIPITITSCSPDGGKGTLIIAGSRGQNRTLDVCLKPRRSGWLVAVLIGSLVLAVFICLACADVVSEEGHKMSDRIAQASWDFSTSWASNITAFGAGFTFLLQLGAFPDRPFFASRTDYALVAAFAAALVVFAPAVNRFINAAAVSRKPRDPVLPAEGLVGAFISASAFTIWGTLLQTAVEILIAVELIKSLTVYRPIGSAVLVCVAFIGIGLGVYCWKTILATVAANATKTGDQPERPRAMFSAAPLDKAVAMEKRVSVL